MLFRGVFPATVVPQALLVKGAVSHLVHWGNAAVLNLSFLETLVILAIVALVLSLCIRDRRRLSCHFKTGLKFGLLLFVLGLPHLVLTVLTFDTQLLFPKHFQKTAPPALLKMIDTAVITVLIGGLIWYLVQIVWHALVFSTAQTQWFGVGQCALSWAKGRELGCPPLLTPILFGLSASILSVLTFHFLGIQASGTPEEIGQLFSGQLDFPKPLRLLSLLMFVVSTAFAEELIFRGVLLGLVLRLAKQDKRFFWLGNMLVLLLWTVGHIANTPAPMIKMGMVFLMGLALGQFARQGGLGAAMAGHAGLNIGIVLLAIPLFYQT